MQLVSAKQSEAGSYIHTTHPGEAMCCGINYSPNYSGL